MRTRNHVLGWLKAHPQSIHGDPLEVMERCEDEVKRRAAVDAWLSARNYMGGQRELWEQRGGCPITSSAFVAREVCSIFAHELRALRPNIAKGAERRFAGEEVLALLDPTAWDELRSWVRELALQEEKKTWKAVVSFTRKSARFLPEQREGIASDFDTTDGSYGHAAAVIAGQLMEQYAALARAAER